MLDLTMLYISKVLVLLVVFLLFCDCLPHICLVLRLLPSFQLHKCMTLSLEANLIKEKLYFLWLIPKEVDGVMREG